MKKSSRMSFAADPETDDLITRIVMLAQALHTHRQEFAAKLAQADSAMESLHQKYQEVLLIKQRRQRTALR